MPANLENSAVATGLEKVTFHSNGCIFPLLLCFSLLFFSQLFVSPPQTAFSLFCIYFSHVYTEKVWFTSSDCPIILVLSDQCKEIEENNRMGKTRDFFRKIRDSKGTFHAKIGSIKGRTGMDLTEAEDIKKRWQDYTEELYKKDLHDPDNHNGVITDLEPDILECEVKGALESITMNKASGGDGIPVELKGYYMIFVFLFLI